MLQAIGPPHKTSAPGVAATAAMRCRDELTRCSRTGGDLAAVLHEHFRAYENDAARKAFACEIMALYYGAPVADHFLAGLQYTGRAMSEGWSHIAGAVFSYVRFAPGDTFETTARRADPITSSRALPSPAPAPRTNAIPTPGLPALSLSQPAYCTNVTMADWNRELGWPGHAPGDCPLKLRHADSGSEQTIMFNTDMTKGGIRWLFYALTGVKVQAQSVQNEAGDSDSVATSSALVIGGEASATAADWESHSTLVEALSMYARTDAAPGAFLSACHLFATTSSSSNPSVEDLISVFPIIDCDMNGAKGLPMATACLRPFETLLARQEAWAALRSVDPTYLLSAAPTLAMYFSSSSMHDRQRLQLVRLFAEAGTVGSGPGAGSLALSSEKVDVLLHTVAALTAGSAKLGGMYLINRSVTVGSAPYSDRYVEALLRPAPPLDGGSADPGTHGLPVGLLLGRSTARKLLLTDILTAVGTIDARILGRHAHGAAAKSEAKTVFSEPTVDGAQLVYRGFLDVTDAELKAFGLKLKEPRIKAQIAGLPTSLLRAFALSQPKSLERNLRVCAAATQTHLLRAELPPRFEERAHGRRVGDDVNNAVTLRWAAASIETLLSKSVNTTRAMERSWADFKACICETGNRRPQWPRLSEEERARMKFMIDAAHVDGPPPPHPSEKIWQRRNGTMLPFTHVLGAAWASAMQHDLGDALIGNLCKKVEVQNGGASAHVYCHNGLSTMIADCLAGYEEGIEPNPYVPPAALAGVFVDKYFKGDGQDGGAIEGGVNAHELMAIRLAMWTEAVRQYDRPEFGEHRNAFEDFIDGFEPVVSAFSD